MVTGRVRVQTRTEARDHLVEADLSEEHVEVTRVPMDRVVDAAPSIRTEGDVTIIPVLEEVAVVEMRLVLREELHIRRRTEQRTVTVPVTFVARRRRVERGLEEGPIQNQAPTRQGNDTMTDMRSSSSGAGSSGRSFGTRAVTAMFDSRSDAEDAVDALIEAGFSREDVRLVPGYEKDVGLPARQLGDGSTPRVPDDGLPTPGRPPVPIRRTRATKKVAASGRACRTSSSPKRTGTPTRRACAAAATWSR